VLDKEENLEQKLLSNRATGVDGENNHLEMLGYLRVIVIFTYLAKPLSLVIVVTVWDMNSRS